MARLTDANMTPAERRVFARLQHAVGYSPKVLFGRDLNTNDALLQRILEKGPRVLYAIAVNGSGQMGKKGVREFRLLVAPVPVPVKLANGTRPAAKPKSRYSVPRTMHYKNKAQWRHNVGVAVKAALAKKRAASVG